MWLWSFNASWDGCLFRHRSRVLPLSRSASVPKWKCSISKALLPPAKHKSNRHRLLTRVLFSAFCLLRAPQPPWLLLRYSSRWTIRMTFSSVHSGFCSVSFSEATINASWSRNKAQPIYCERMSMPNWTHDTIEPQDGHSSSQFVRFSFA